MDTTSSPSAPDVLHDAATADFIATAARDMVVWGVAGGLLTWPFFGEGQAFSVTCGLLWMALNFSLLGWLLESLLGRRESSRVFNFSLACAKIPASYFILYWLYSSEYFEPVGLSAGLAALPAVLLVRALISQRG